MKSFAVNTREQEGTAIVIGFVFCNILMVLGKGCLPFCRLITAVSEELVFPFCTSQSYLGQAIKLV